MTEHGGITDDLFFAPEPPGEREKQRPSGNPWKVLIVDDDEDIHVVTRMVLADFTFEGRRLELFSAYGAEEGKKLLDEHPDTAILLLDVVMERDDSGLLLARHIREVMGNRAVRIVLRTGFPGMAPIEKVIVDYDINDYAEKSELTSQRLHALIISSLRSYRDIVASMDLSRRLREQIAERRRAERKLRLSEERFATIFTNIGIGITLISPKMEILFMNPVMERSNPHIDVSRHPVCYMSFNTPPREEVCSYCPTIETFRDGQVHVSVTDTPSPEGIRHYRIISTPVFSADGEVSGVIEAVEDVTERMLADAALRQNETYLQGILEATADGILAVDDKGRIIKANRRFAELWRIPQHMIDAGEDKILLDFVLEQLPDPEAFLCKVNALYGTETRTVDIITFKDGRIFERISAPLVLEGAVIGRVWSFRDITEKKKMEEEILRNQKLESVGLLAGGIAHDFNNLLTAILGNISLAKAQLPAEDRTMARLGEAEKASLRAKDLTQQLLTFARGGAPVRRSSSVSDLIRETVCFALSGSNVRCEFAIDPELHPVEIDEGQISQVIHNLIINADQAMPVGGTLRVACDETTLAEGEVPPLKEGRYIRITVSDQGVGIPAEHLQRIFDPYFTTKEKGRGLGLAGAYSIIRNHDGQVSVSSVPGVGTTFTIFLPVTGGAKLIDNDESDALIKGMGRVLVMDDEELVLEIAGGMLSYLGYEAEFARNGSEAVELFRQGMESGAPFKAVICDLTIPGGMGGKEMLEILRELDREVKVIASSGYSNDPVMAKYRSYGFNGVIAKPYRIEEISQVMASLFD